MTTIYFVRHAESQGNVDRIFQGCSNGKLSANGKTQLKYLAKRFRKISLEKIYTSPFERAVETAKALSANDDLPIVTDDMLCEIDGGLFEGRKFSQLPEVFPELWEQWSEQPHLFTAPGGESMRNVYERMKYTVEKIAHDSMGLTVAIVSHGCALRNLLCYLLDKPFDLLDEVPWGDNTCVTKVVFDKHFHPHVEYMNDVVHLPEKYSTLSKQDWWQSKGLPSDKEEKYIHIKSGELFATNDEMLLSKGSVTTDEGTVAVENAKVHIEEGTVYLEEDRIRVLAPSEKKPESTVKIEDSDKAAKSDVSKEIAKAAQEESSQATAEAAVEAVAEATVEAAAEAMEEAAAASVEPAQAEVTEAVAEAVVS